MRRRLRGSKPITTTPPTPSRRTRTAGATVPRTRACPPAAAGAARPALLRPIQIGIYFLVPEKPLAWLGSTLRDLRTFPEDARREAGSQPGRVQQGLTPTDWKPMSTVGPGVIEIRVHTALEHRVFYVAKFEEAVYVLHAFEKRERRTPQAAIDVARTRLADLLRGRARAQKTQ